MAYEKTVWVDGTTKLNAENLNHIETGLEEASNNVDTETNRATEAESILQTQIDTTDTKLNKEINRATETESTLQTQIDTTNTNLDNEINRATTAEAALDIANAAEAARATAAEATLQEAINTKLDLKPDGTNYLLVSNKLNPLYIPDSILGQVIYGGTIASNGVCTLSDIFKSKYPDIGSVTITSNSANAYTGVYFIASADVNIAAGTYDAIELLTGDWLLSNGNTGYVKVDNTDAVTGVKGDSESTYRIGNINLTADNIGTYDKDTITSKIATETARAKDAETFDTASSFSAKYPNTTEHLWRIKLNFPDASNIFRGYNLIDIFSLYTANVISMQAMFNDCTSLISVPAFNTAKVTNMSYMFYNCASLTSAPAFNTANVVSMDSMFRGCASLISVPAFNTANVTSMATMFGSCHSLTSAPAFNTANVTSMASMFGHCASLISVPAFNTANVTSMASMFYNCSRLVSVPAFNTANVTSMASMFSNCTSLKEIHMFGMKASFDISASTLFTRDNLNEVIGNLATVTTTQTLTMGATNLAKLTAEDIAIGTNKGWTIA